MHCGCRRGSKEIKVTPEETDTAPETFGAGEFHGLFSRVMSERAALLESSECARHYLEDPEHKCGWHRQELGQSGMDLIDHPRLVFLARALTGLRCKPDEALEEWKAAVPGTVDDWKNGVDVLLETQGGYTLAEARGGDFAQEFARFMQVCTSGEAQFARGGVVWGDVEWFWHVNGQRLRLELENMSILDRLASAALEVLEALERENCELQNMRDAGRSLYLYLKDKKTKTEITARISDHGQGTGMGELSETQLMYGKAEIMVNWQKDNGKEKALAMLAKHRARKAS